MAQSPGLNEAVLLRRSSGGDEAAFTALYRCFQGPVFRFALQMSGNRTMAEEVTQEVFMALIRGGSQVDITRGPLIAWLLGVARNHVLKGLERNSRYRSLGCIDAEDEWAKPCTSSRMSNGANPAGTCLKFRPTIQSRKAVPATRKLKSSKLLSGIRAIKLKD